MANKSKGGAPVANHPSITAGAGAVAEPIVQLFPLAASWPIVSVLGPIADHSAQLAATEAAAVTRAVPKRQREFSTGRVFARSAMRALALPEVAIPQGAQRAPVWPVSVRGSISHTERLAWVVASHAHALQGIGADLERLNRLEPDLHKKLFTASEQRLVDSSAPSLATILFCAKEAVYKATNPIAGAFIGFQEVEVQFNDAHTVFGMRYLGEHDGSRIMQQGRGYVRTLEDHAFALFLIPAPDTE